MKQIREVMFFLSYLTILLLLISKSSLVESSVLSQRVRVYNFTINESLVDDFNRFILRSPAGVPNSLKNHLMRNNNGETFVLFKAAEIAVEKYKRNPEKSYHLRQILGINEVRDFHANRNSFKLHVVLQDTVAGILEETQFIVTIQKKQKEVSLELDELRPKRSHQVINITTICDELSAWAKCKNCGFNGICDKGNAKVSPWLDFALRTQRELQHDVPFNQLQMLGAHNAFNDRSDGYGTVDDCHWPPPYNKCIDFANQEFSFTDLLNMGVRALEIDPWWCFGKIRMSHAHDEWYLGCAPWDREFEDGIKEIGMWVHKPENTKEIVRLYFEDGATHTAGHDDLINGPIRKYLGDKVLTPEEMKKYFPKRWPTPREMIQIDKTVLIATGGDYNHKGIFIHKGYWSELTVNQFVPYPKCSNSKPNVTTRVYSDSTHYGPFWNGPNKTGVVLDYQKFMKCGINYLGADQVNPNLLRTAVFSWAPGEPHQSLAEDSCIIVCAKDERWHVETCTEQHYFACLKGMNEWALSRSSGIYTQPTCPDGYKFSVPRNGYEHQKLLEIIKGRDVWINFTPFIPLVTRVNS